MSFFNRLVAVVITAVLVGPVVPIEARTRKGDRYLAQGRLREEKKEWDAALRLYEQALSEDPAELVYQMSTQRARFEASQVHMANGGKLRAQGQLGEALIEYQKAYAIDPGSMVAAQETARTQEMIQRERKRVEETGKEAPPAVRALTPVEEVKRQDDRKMQRLQTVPELKPLNPLPRDLKFNAQPVKVLFETIGKIADINVVWDPDYQNPQKNSINIDLGNATVQEALDYVSIMTKSYWKPLSPNTIFITNDNPNKRRDFAEMVAQTFYINNVSLPQEIQEIVNAVRSVTELQRVVAYNAQRAIIVRGEADQVALAGKMIHDLDKPRAEVVVDILVLEASTSFNKQITAAIASTGLNQPISFTPRSSIQVQGSSTTSSSTSSSTSTSTTTTPGATTPTSSTSGAAIPISQLGHIATADFSTTLPGALLQAALSDTKTKVLQAPQLRAVDNTKASLKIGQKEPTATGSFQPGIGGVGINPLVNTQFTFIDVGVNVTILPQVHDNGDISMNLDLDISNVAGQVNLGGINQPIIGQRHVVHDIRLHEGEVSLLGGLIQEQDTKTMTGIPGLSAIPGIGKLFQGNSMDKERDEIMIALIPHIVRRAELTPENLRGISVGNATTIKLNYGPAQPDQGPLPKPIAGMPDANAPAGAAPVAAVVAPAVTQPAISMPSTTTPAAPSAAAPPATAPPATAPPATASPATASPMSPSTVPAADVKQPDPPEGGARVRFAPAQIDAGVAASVTASLTLEGGVDVNSVPIQIQYDPKILRLDSVTRGDFFSQDGQQPIFTKNIQNENGSAAIQLSRMPGSPGLTGNGVLLVLTFQTIGKGATLVTVPNLALRNSQGQASSAGTPRLAVNVK